MRKIGGMRQIKGATVKIRLLNHLYDKHSGEKNSGKEPTEEV